MSQSHNIAGSEAFKPGPSIKIRELPNRRVRRSQIARWVVNISVLAVGVGLVDAAIGAPVGFVIVALAFLVAWLRG